MRRDAKRLSVCRVSSDPVSCVVGVCSLIVECRELSVCEGQQPFISQVLCRYRLPVCGLSFPSSSCPCRAEVFRAGNTQLLMCSGALGGVAKVGCVSCQAVVQGSDGFSLRLGSAVPLELVCEGGGSVSPLGRGSLGPSFRTQTLLERAATVPTCVSVPGPLSLASLRCRWVLAISCAGGLGQGHGWDSQLSSGQPLGGEGQPRVRL